MSKDQSETSLPLGMTSCTVCGDSNAVAKHYGVMACLGCKGFFRRALKKADQYECINDDNCEINQYERNSCRSCRFKKCLDVGMNPAAVRPDRDFTSKKQVNRITNATAKRIKTYQSSLNAIKQESNNLNADVWKKLPVEMRTMIMNLLNIEIKICRGDTKKEVSQVYPLHIQTIREIIEDPVKLKGKRTEMRYEPYRMARNDELHVIVYRRLIAAIDWVDYLSEIMGGICIEDKIALVKQCFGPLMLFKNAARTAAVTNDENILCVCNFSYVPRNMANAYTDSYHLDNGLVGRMLDELVSPLRKLQVSEAELVCLSAIIVLNPMTRDLSEIASNKVFELRNRIQNALYQYLKEIFDDQAPTTRFGSLLLYLPILTTLANTVRENLRFAQTFSSVGGIPLLQSLFGCFPVEPFLDSGERRGIVLHKSVATQAEYQSRLLKNVKHHVSKSFTSPAENETTAMRDFYLLQPPCSYTLIEMFDDRINNANSMQNPQSPSDTQLVEDHLDASDKECYLHQQQQSLVVGHQKSSLQSSSQPQQQHLTRLSRTETSEAVTVLPTFEQSQLSVHINRTLHNPCQISNGYPIVSHNSSHKITGYPTMTATHDSSRFCQFQSRQHYVLH